MPSNATPATHTILPCNSSHAASRARRYRRRFCSSLGPFVIRSFERERLQPPPAQGGHRGYLEPPRRLEDLALKAGWCSVILVGCSLPDNEKAGIVKRRFLNYPYARSIPLVKTLGDPKCPSCGIGGAEHIGCVESVNTDSKGDHFTIVTCNKCGHIHGVLPLSSIRTWIS